MADNTIVKQTEIFQIEKTEVLKEILTSINKDFKVENILGIGDISFDFDFEIPQNDTFKFPNDIVSYTVSKDASLLEVVNNIIWLYLCHKEDFNEKLEQFNRFVQMAETREEFVFLYPAYHEIHIELLDEIISKSDCKENNFEEFQALFYHQYGIDLKEYLDKKPIHEERNPETIYKDYQINKSRNQILKNIASLNTFSPENRKIAFKIHSSKPIHKLIKSYSSYIEINPLITKKELKKLFDEYFNIYNEFAEMLNLFGVEYDDNMNEIQNKTTQIYDLNSNVPSTKSAIQVIKKAMILHMIMEHNQTNNFDASIRYLNYYWLKENYQALQIEGLSLFDLLNDDEYTNLDGVISLKQDNNFSLALHSETKHSIRKLVNFLKHSL